MKYENKIISKFPLYITIKAYAILYRGRGNTERDKAKYEMAEYSDINVYP